MKLDGIMMRNTEMVYPVKRLQENGEISTAVCTCHIVETDCSAGIFLRNGLEWMLKPSLSGYNIDSFTDFESAKEELIERYPELESFEPLTLDRLYFVPSKPLYTVIVYTFGAIITQDQYQLDFIISEATKEGTLLFVQAGLTYDDAQRFVKIKFREMTAKPHLNIDFDFPVESAFVWNDVCKILGY